jgi:DNA-binding NarL/FixJ family response regulator
MTGNVTEDITTNRARILMLEDDVLMWRAVQRSVGRLGEVIQAASCAAGNELLAQGPWTCLFIDLALPDGSGLEWLAGARRSGCDAPALVITNHLERALVNEAFDLQAFYACKPASANSFRAFVESLAVRDRANQDVGLLLTATAMHVLEAHALTGSEMDVVAASLSGTTTGEFVESHGISINTYKTQVRSILRKTGARSIGEVRDRVLRENARTSAQRR